MGNCGSQHQPLEETRPDLRPPLATFQNFSPGSQNDHRANTFLTGGLRANPELVAQLRTLLPTVVRFRQQQCDGSPCLHEHAGFWDGMFHCARCAAKLDQERVAIEEKHVEDAKHQDEETDAVERLHQLALSPELIVAFVAVFECNDMPTEKVFVSPPPVIPCLYIFLPQVVSEIIRPLTANPPERLCCRPRCRFAELLKGMGSPVADHVGPATVFRSIKCDNAYMQCALCSLCLTPVVLCSSHTWRAPFEDLVASTCDGAATTRRLWVDIFAVRQVWTGS